MNQMSSKGPVCFVLRHLYSPDCHEKTTVTLVLDEFAVRTRLGDGSAHF